MKTLKIILLGLILVFMFSCGGSESEPKPDEITGTWKTSNLKIEENTCNLGKTLTEGVRYYKISGEGTNLDFIICKDQSCAEPRELGQYSFKSSIAVNYSEEKDSHFYGYDCKIKLNIEDKFVFSSADSASLKSKFVNQKEGSECTALKARLEKSDDTKHKEFAKLLNDSCTLSISASLKKQ